MNTFGSLLRLTTFGESHGKAVGVVVDGFPAGVYVDEELLLKDLSLRQGGSSFTTARKEEDKPVLLSGVYKGYSTGSPIALMVENKAYASKDYEGVIRPGHADYTYLKKYENVDLRGGGRSSARESVARVMAGSLAKMLLKEFDVKVEAGLKSVGEVRAKGYDYAFAKTSKIFCLGSCEEAAMKERILKAKNEGDSVGACVALKASGLIPGLGEPLYDKLSSKLAHALLGINAAKGLEFGKGFKASLLQGSQNNDQFSSSGFYSNNSGGLLGGLTSGEDLLLKVYFKPTPSIFLPQRCQDKDFKDLKTSLKGRHDPCVGVRAVCVVEAMSAFVLADALLLNATTNLKGLKSFYK